MKKIRNLLAITAALLVSIAAEMHGQSALDGFDPNANASIRAVVIQPDGKILLGGDFTTLSPNGGAAVIRNHIARLNPDGTLDTAFDPNANQSVWSIAVQGDGQILVGGDFNGADSIGGQSRNHIARLDATTGLADSFNPGADGPVLTFTIQADGKILVGGRFSRLGNGGGGPINHHNIGRLNSDGTVDEAFDSGAGEDVKALLVQPDGKILVGGIFTILGGGGSAAIRNYIGRLNADGTVDATFDPGASLSVLALALQADGKILVGGVFVRLGGGGSGTTTRNRIGRLNPDGTLDMGFNPNANGEVGSVAVQANGDILVSGWFTSIGGQTRNRIARLDAGTGLAESFDPNANGVANLLAVQADGKILAGGVFTTIGGQTRNRIARLEPDGRVDRTLVDLNIPVAKFGVGQVKATAVQPDGKILIGGSFYAVLGVTRHKIARLNTDGTLDIAFNPDVEDFISNVVNSIAVLPDGKILVGGDFTRVSGQTRNYIARLDATTGLADSFDPNANDVVHSIAVQADGKILAGGYFTSIGGQPRNRIARLDGTTGLADSFDPNADSIIISIAVQADSKILVGGGFTSIGGQTRHRIARLTATGFADSFAPNANEYVAAIAVQMDGKVLASGPFTSIGGQARNRIARLDGTTGLADSFNPNPNAEAYSIAVQADGKILAGGLFSNIGGQTRNHIARLDATTGLADSFDPNADNVVWAMVPQADGKILVGGAFTSIGEETRSAVARLSNDTAALQGFTATQTTVTWTRSGSSVQFTRVTFESSPDNVNYATLGSGAPAGSNWILTGLNLPTGQNLYVRARGYYRSGIYNGSESITESVRNVFLAGPTGTPTPTPTPTPTATATTTPTPTPTPTPRPSTLGNISTRLQVGTSDRVMIAGFIVQGSSPKRVLIRAAGPSLTQVGVPNALANPQLELHDSTGTIGRNDNWQTTQIGGVITADQVAEIQNSGLAPSDPVESAVIATLTPGSYTAIVQGINDGTGVGIVEVYDLDATSGSLLANISTRGFVQTGDNVMIGGFIVVTQPTRVIIRAIGPSLTKAGVPDALANPQLELHDASSAIGQNNDWQTTQLGGIITSDQVAEIQNSQLAPTNAAESAIIATLQPGNYTAIVRGVNSTTGNALVEVYALP